MREGEESYRLCSCRRCARQVRICRRCDRGNLRPTPKMTRFCNPANT